MLNNTQKSDGAFCPVDALAGQLRQAEDLARNLGNAQLVQPWSIHDTGGTLLALSDRAAEMVGAKGKRPAGHFLDHVQVHDRVALACFLAGSAGSNEAMMQFRPLAQGAASAHWIEIVPGECLAGGERGMRVFTWRDISVAKEAEAAALRLQEEAEQASIAKGRFLANMSHELRTPLNAILGFSDLLGSPLAQGLEEARKTEYIGLIHHSAKHLLDVLNGILDMSKIEHGMYEIVPSRFDLARCLETTTAIMRGQAEARCIRIETTGFDEAPEIVADERAVRQILINLLSNAIKFSPEEAAVSVAVSRTAGTVTIAVQDRGIGISPENIAQLGTPFFQAGSRHDRRYEGTGLGLSVVKGLVELHGGTVSFSSRRGEGTRAKVCLPVHGSNSRKVAAPGKISRIARAQSQPDGAQSSEPVRNLKNSA